MVSMSIYIHEERKKEAVQYEIMYSLCAIRTFIYSFCLCTHVDFHPPSNAEPPSNNDTTQAILQSIPAVLHKYLKPRNNSQGKYYLISTALIISCVHMYM